MEFHKDEMSSMMEFRAAFRSARKKAQRRKTRLSSMVAIYRSYWKQNYPGVELDLSDEGIEALIRGFRSIQEAVQYYAESVLYEKSKVK